MISYKRQMRVCFKAHPHLLLERLNQLLSSTATVAAATILLFCGCSKKTLVQPFVLLWDGHVAVVEHYGVFCLA